MYTEKELVGIAKRENNTRRTYLVVNKLQGKHVPVNPKTTLKMYDDLAKIISEEYRGEKLLLVGFAETATAIGSRLAVDADSYYMQTTRECIENVEYLYFTESHSHATEQKLVKTDLDKIIGEIQRIVFVEDEVTTGNTILKIIDIIQNTYEKEVKFSVAALLNGMDEKSGEVYDKRNIKLHYLVKTEHSGYTEVAEQYLGDGEYCMYPEKCNAEYPVFEADRYVNARRLLTGKVYQKACEALYAQIIQWYTFTEGENVLVIGTEECMYPAIFVAAKIGELGCGVCTHSTTRSPIVVSSEEEYPLHNRYELHSIYEDQRQTFIYDLKKYDKVIIITDAKNQSDKGIQDLCSHLEKVGNTDISVIRWCE